ncbi:CRISPR-associated endonuclease Cas2 [Paenibacillus crassostreae]|uniref:CRISPR-associated endoribonuclease Cas2 n=1 Tax=Paenibacillus crassostreae TaxID=1763538 RepID=A0A167CDY1_9BACL|nr:CRISPR-associated endonuclease Cas2 [Paenibacillus crassostreae]AOZ91807.1 CRISPR-associated endonuclease Cas2 [Paenibacillus crassostreae]OAB73088.1 CRISPR-associated protein Cas2 [Paenibacillus crassostreae]
MLVLITYDVSTISDGGTRRLRVVAKKCEDYGVRVQNSVFECIVDATQLKKLEIELEELIDPTVDSLRFYILGNNHKRKVNHIGAKPSLDVEGPLIF